MKIRDIDVKDLEFIRTSEGRIGVGISNPNGGEEGGFKVLKWCPDSLLKTIEKELLMKDAVRQITEAL